MATMLNATNTSINVKPESEREFGFVGVERSF